MRIQFWHNTTEEFITEFEIAEPLTKEQAKMIEEVIFNTMEEYEEEFGDFEGFDWWECCFHAVKRAGVEIILTPINKIFYI